MTDFIRLQGEVMDSMLVLASGMLLAISPMLIIDAFANRRHREVAFFVFVAILAGMINYASLSALSAPGKSPHYLNILVIIGSLGFGFFAAWAMSTPKRKKKSLGRNKLRK